MEFDFPRASVSGRLPQNKRGDLIVAAGVFGRDLIIYENLCRVPGREEQHDPMVFQWSYKARHPRQVRHCFQEVPEKRAEELRIQEVAEDHAEELSSGSTAASSLAVGAPVEQPYGHIDLASRSNEPISFNEQDRAAMTWNSRADELALDEPSGATEHAEEIPIRFGRVFG